MVGVSASYDGDDTAGVVFDTDECSLDIFWISAVIALDAAVLGVCLVKLEVGWFTVYFTEVVLDGEFGSFLELVVEGGFDR